MPCLDAVLKACRRGADKQGRVAALLKQEQQCYTRARTFVSGISNQVLGANRQSPSRPLETSLRHLHNWTGVSQQRLIFVNAAVSRHQVVAMSEVDKAKEAAASGYVCLCVPINRA